MSNEETIMKKWNELKQLTNVGYVLFDFLQEYEILANSIGDMFVLYKTQKEDWFICHTTMKEPQQLHLDDFENTFENMEHKTIIDVMDFLYHSNKTKLLPEIYFHLWFCGNAVVKEKTIVVETETETAIREDIERVKSIVPTFDANDFDVDDYKNMLIGELGMKDYISEQTLYDTIEKIASWLMMSYQCYNCCDTTTAKLAKDLYKVCVEDCIEPLYTSNNDDTLIIHLQGNKK